MVRIEDGFHGGLDPSGGEISMLRGQTEYVRTEK